MDTPLALDIEHKLNRMLAMQEQTLRMAREGFMPAAEFARRTGLRHKLILEKCERLQLAHRREGKLVLIPYSELERWLAEAQAQRVADEARPARRSRLMKDANETGNTTAGK